jgi:sugar phosphate isomerase/epimerase
MHDRISFDSLCFPTSTLQQVKGYWHELGARRVSILAVQLTPETVGEVKEILASGPFPLETIAGHIFVQGHLSRRQEDWVEPRARLNTLIDLAAEVGAHSIYMLTGGHGGLTWEEGAECFSRAIAPCVEHANHAGVALCIETASWVYADIHLAHTLRDAVTLVEMAGIGINIDLLSSWTEAGLKESIERAITRCNLVQVCDYTYGDRSFPCRTVPGDGNMPLERLVGWILEAGYEGAFDLELLGPRIDQEGQLEAVRRSGEYMTKLLESLGA